MKVLTTDDIEVKGGKVFSTSDKSDFTFVDSWKKQKAPDRSDLLKEYERTAYTCANLNVNGVLNARLRLFTVGQSNRFRTMPIDRATQKQLSRNPRLKLSLAGQEDVEEVSDHPLLNLLNNPNPQNDGCDLLGYIQLYQETIGTTYVKLVKDRLGLPQELWVLPSQHIKPIKDKGTGQIVGYEYGSGANKQLLSIDEVIVFMMRNPIDPYGAIGLSPLRAAWESLNLESKMMATEAAILDNDGRPSGILSPKEPIGEHEAGRWEHRYNAKFRQSGSGNVMVTEEDVNFLPLTFPPKDLAALQIAKATKLDVTNAFGIPAALLEGNQFNRATLEGSILQHVRQAVWPRLRAMESRLNKSLVSLYGDNLFLAFDDPSPESEDIKATTLRTLVDGGILLRNEARLEIDKPPVDGGDILTGMPGASELGSGSADTATDKPDSPSKPSPTDATQTPDVPQEGDNIQQQALNGSQIQSLLAIAELIAASSLPAESGQGIIAAAFPSLTQEQINAIIGPLENFEQQEPQANPNEPPQEPQANPNETATNDGKSLVILNQKAVDPRWVQPPSSDDLEKLSVQFFKKYRASALQQVKKDIKGNVARKDFQPLDTARDELAKKAQPIIEIFIKEGAKELIQRIGANPDIFDVTNPKVIEAIKDAAFAFADSTNKATTLTLNDAIEKLRAELGEGLDSGARLHELTKRVNEIFDGLEKFHAKTIAQTEASRAHHEGLRAAAKESGVVKGFELLLSPDACPICQDVFKKNKRIGLDDYFIEGEGVYGNRLVPIHPNCRCSLIEILDIQA